jgi:hypothetical protein
MNFPVLSMLGAAAERATPRGMFVTAQVVAKLLSMRSGVLGTYFDASRLR